MLCPSVTSHCSIKMVNVSSCKQCHMVAYRLVFTHIFWKAYVAYTFICVCKRLKDSIRLQAVVNTIKVVKCPTLRQPARWTVLLYLDRSCINSVAWCRDSDQCVWSRCVWWWVCVVQVCVQWLMCVVQVCVCSDQCVLSRCVWWWVCGRGVCVMSVCVVQVCMMISMCGPGVCSD